MTAELCGTEARTAADSGGFTAGHTRAERTAIEFLRSFFGSAYRQEFSVHLWTGAMLPALRNARFTLGIRRRTR